MLAAQKKALDEKKARYIVPDEIELARIFDEEEMDGFKTVFATADADGGGSIDHDELAKLIRKFEPDLLDEEVDAKVHAMLGESSADGDDEIGMRLLS